MEYQQRPTPTRPLTGIVVVELAGLAPAPMAGLVLADLGATVVRVDRPGQSRPGDLLVRGKLAVEADLKAPDGRERLHQLLKRSDVLLEPFRPGVLEGLGLGPEALRKQYPRLIIARLVGFPRDGPRGKQAGHDINYLAVSGVLSLLGRAGGPPEFPVNLLADFAGGGLMCALCIVASLFQRAHTGQGCVVDVNMVHGVQYLASFLRAFNRVGLQSRPRGTNLLDSGAHMYHVYKTKGPLEDGQFMAAGALEPAFYAELIQRLAPHLTTEERAALDAALPDPAQVPPSVWARGKRALTSVFLRHPRAFWEDVFRDSDACVTAVADLSEIPSWPKLQGTGARELEAGEENWLPLDASASTLDQVLKAIVNSKASKL